jgi:hypothetical protein
MGLGTNPQSNGKPQEGEKSELEEGVKKDGERKEVSRNTERKLNVLKEARQPPFNKTLTERFAGEKSGFLLENAGDGFENAIELSGDYTVRLFFRLNTADLKASMHVEEYNMIVEGLSKFFKGGIPEGLSVDETEEFVKKRNELFGDQYPFYYLTGGNYGIKAPTAEDKIGEDKLKKLAELLPHRTKDRKGKEIWLSMRSMRLNLFVPGKVNGKQISLEEREKRAEDISNFLQEYMRFKPEECARFKEKYFKIRDDVQLDKMEHIGLVKIGNKVPPDLEPFASEKQYGEGDENEIRRFIVLNTILCSELTTAHSKEKSDKYISAYTPAALMEQLRPFLEGKWKKDPNKPDKKDPMQNFTDNLQKYCPTWQEMTEEQKETYKDWLRPRAGRNDWFHLTADSFSGSTEK